MRPFSAPTNLGAVDLLDEVAADLEVLLLADLLDATAGRTMTWLSSTDQLAALPLDDQSRSFWPWMKTCSAPALSSNRSSLKPPPPFELLDLSALFVCSSGRS